MKKIFLFAILALSVNAYSQTIHHPPKSIEQIRFRTGILWLSEGTDLNSELNFGQTIYQQTQNPQEFIQIIDSAYHWLWDTLSAGWRLHSGLTNTVYDTHHNLMSYTGQVRSGGAEWVNFYQRINTYDGNNNRTSYIRQAWNGVIWVNDWQYIFSYDANNNQTSELDQSWSNGAWVLDSQILESFDANNFAKGQSFKFWNIAGTKIASGDSSYTFYHTVLGINDLITQGTGITVFPNPSSDKVTIATPNNGHLSILNHSGQPLLQQEISEPTTTIDVSGFKSGVYLVRMMADKKMITGKFIKN